MMFNFEKNKVLRDAGIGIPAVVEQPVQDRRSCT